MSDLLEVRDIHTFIGQFHILEGVSVNVPPGSITVLLGRNGAGKTTTMRSIIGMTPPAQGEIRFMGERINGKRPHRIAQMGIGYVPEYRAIFRELTVAEHLRLAERRNGDWNRKRDFIFELFPDLERLNHLRGSQLSGGQQQMLAIARALVPDNRLLLIDEPSEGLAPVIIQHLMTAIRRLSTQSTVLLVEQNFRMASRLADRFVIIDNGRSAVAGAMPDLVGDSTTVQLYLGVA